MILKRLPFLIAGAALLSLYGCGSNESTGGQLVGTAATGAAMANAAVTVTDTSGGSPCVETSISTTDLGSYVCTLKAGERAPFFIVVTDPTGQKAPLVSIATQTPIAGTPLTVNATPLTTAIMAQLDPSGNGDPLAVVASKTFVAADLAAVTTNVLAQLAPVLSAIGNPAGYNPFTTSITAATTANTGNTADQLLDIVKIVTDPGTGKLAFSTITNPIPVALATASIPGVTVLAPAASASDLGQAAQLAAKAFNTCFVLPTAQRVLAKDTTIAASKGGPEVTQVAPACQNIVADGVNVSPAYLQNGYNGGQAFYSLLTSDTMTGAKFSVPEIMAFYPADSTNADVNKKRDRAVLNIRYIDNAGNPGNIITVAANIPSSSTTARPSNWWLVGNQEVVDILIKPEIRQFKQLRTGGSNYFMTGMRILISTTGPNSTGLTAAHIKGPGLPTAGLWYFTNSESFGGVMDPTKYRNSSTPNPNPYVEVCHDCPVYWFAHTTGPTGTAADTTYGKNSPSLEWAQGSDEGSYSGGAIGRPAMGRMYTVNLYSGTTLSYTIQKTILNDVIDPAVAYKLPWNTLGASSLAALDINNTALNGLQNALTLDWIQNPAAQQISGVAVSINSEAAISPIFGVAKGLTNTTVTSPATDKFTSIAKNSDGTIASTRTLYFAYRMLDGSSKKSVFAY